MGIQKDSSLGIDAEEPGHDAPAREAVPDAGDSAGRVELEESRRVVWGPTVVKDPDSPDPGSERESEVLDGAGSAEILTEETTTTTTRRKRGLKAWVGKGAKKVVSKIYASSADDLEERARRAVGSAYRDQADDLEERAVRAMRQAILSEADKIKEAVEHGIAVKRREVRLSLVVLVSASLVYLALYWLTRGGAS